MSGNSLTIDLFQCCLKILLIFFPLALVIFSRASDSFVNDICSLISKLISDSHKHLIFYCVVLIFLWQESFNILLLCIVNIKCFKVCHINVSTGPHTLSFPWKYRTVSAGTEIPGCQTKIVNPDSDGNGEVGH